MTPNEKRLLIEIGRALLRLQGSSVELGRAIVAVDADRINHHMTGTPPPPPPNDIVRKP